MANTDVAIALGIAGCFSTLIFTIFMYLVIDIQTFDWRRYICLLHYIQANGIALSANDIRQIESGGKLTVGQTLDYLSFQEFHTRHSDNVTPMSSTNSPWHWKRVNPITGEVSAHSLKEHIYQDTRSVPTSPPAT